jgi:asparagine synthase (glutamine-hydrolysing)
MCGICGIALTRQSDRQIDRSAVSRMRDVLVHRGPDDAGLYVDGGTALGHRRLSIVDVEGGHQPMSTDDGAYHIVYNGEVYNHADLRGFLTDRGHRYRTRCDTETVLRLYQEEGARSVERLRGMFAFAIWDAHGRQLFLARDRLGVKPLYYVHAADGSLFFASEIKALLAVGAVSPALNLPVLPDYLANHAPSGEETLIAGVRRLAPGHTLSWRDGRIQIAQYWSPPIGDGAADRRSEADLVAEFSARFTEAVRLRLMADVPLGVFLSGGIDSAAITAAMSRLVPEPVRSFSVAFRERSANELSYARVVARAFGTQHHETVVSPDDFFNALPRLVWHEDEPLAHPSSVPLYFVARLAADHVKVVLTGEGSDEALGGYARYWKTLLNLRLGRVYHGAVPAALCEQVHRFIDRTAPGSAVARRLGRTFLRHPAELVPLYFDNFAVFSRARQQALLSAAAQQELGGAEPYGRMRQYFDDAEGASLLSQLLYADQRTYLHELLMKQDQMSMAASIESRVPFLDHPLLEFTAGLPDRLKLRGLTTKYILRASMRSVLPRAILSRRKMGFPVPFGTWVRGDHRWILDEYVLAERALGRGLFDPAYIRTLVREHMAGADHSERLWALLNFEIWQRVVLEGESTELQSSRPAATTVRAPEQGIASVS